MNEINILDNLVLDYEERSHSSKKILSHDSIVTKNSIVTSNLKSVTLESIL